MNEHNDFPYTPSRTRKLLFAKFCSSFLCVLSKRQKRHDGEFIFKCSFSRGIPYKIRKMNTYLGRYSTSVINGFVSSIRQNLKRNIFSIVENVQKYISQYFLRCKNKLMDGENEEIVAFLQENTFSSSIKYEQIANKHL